MQWVQDPSQGNADNVSREGSKQFRNIKKEYLRAKIEELENNCKLEKILRTCIGASVTLRRVAILELT
jgi:hypothetical protein